MPPSSPPSLKKNRGRSASKSTSAYWLNKVFLEKKGSWLSPTYFVRMQARGERRKIRLESSMKEEAAKEAQSLFLKVTVNGWEAISPPPTTSPPANEIENQPSELTIEGWITKARTCSAVRKSTFNKYAESLKTIVGEVLKLTSTRKKESRSLIHSFPISKLTKAVLQEWQDHRVQKARLLDPVKTRCAQNTIRTLIANSRSLFSKEILESVDPANTVLGCIPFDGIKRPSKFTPRYVSRFDAESLLVKAAEELGTPPDSKIDPDSVGRFEQWKIIYFALVVGLRYNEIDTLRTREIDVKSGRISVRTHEEFQPKTLFSEGDVMVGAKACEVITTMLKHTEGIYFVKAGSSNRCRSYRAGLYHDHALKWLRSYEERGTRPLADVHKPLHELRKEAGTLVNNLHGLNEAKNFLRHGSIQTTAAFYVGSKGNITTGIG